MAVVAVSAALVLAGCGTSGGNDAAPDPGGSVVTTADDGATTTTVPDGADDPSDLDDAHLDAGARYLEIVERPNCVGAAFDDTANEIPDEATTAEAMDALQPAAAAVVEANEEFATRLEEGPWPPDTEPLVDDLLAELRAETELYEQIATAPDEDAFLAAYEALMDSLTAERTEANALRDALGLDEAPIEVDCTQYV